MPPEEPNPKSKIQNPKLLRLLLSVFWLLSLIPRGVKALVVALRQALKQAADFFALAQRQVKKRRRGKWHFHIGKPIREEDVRLPQREMERLLRRSRDLKDFDDLERFGSSFRLPEQDFIVTRAQVQEILRRILEAHPPFLYLGRTLPDPEQSVNAPPRVEKIRKKEIVRVQGLIDLLVPEEHPRYHRSDMPPGDQAMRAARSMSELWRAPLLDQVMPPRLQVERLAHGDLMVTEYVRTEPHVEFVPRQRLVDYEEERETEVEIELEAPDPDERTQLIYFLLDTSASMRGMSATLAAAVFCAVHRANMAAPAMYYMRTFSEYLEPGWGEPPWIAHTLMDRESLYEKIFSLNFNGAATHTGWALEQACKDIEAARTAHDALSRASIVLITDGRSDLMPDTIAAVMRTRAPLHTIMVSRERNMDLERISDSFTTLSGLPDLTSPSPSGALPEE